MKKLMLCGLLLGLVSCNDDQYLLSDTNEHPLENHQESEMRSYDEIIEAACRAASIVDTPDKPLGRSANTPRKVDTKQGAIMLRHPNSRSTSYEQFPIYIVNYENNMGSAIISSNKQTEAVLAVTIEGNIQSLDEIDNPGFLMFMDAASNYINSGNYTLPPYTYDKPVIKFDEICGYETDTIWHANIPPRIPNMWAQTYPEGLLCPNGKSGCSNTAMALILSYYEIPTEIPIYNREGQIEGTAHLNWSDIKKHMRFEGAVANYSCSENDITTAHTQLAQLCRYLGVINESTYGEIGTSTDRPKWKKTMQSKFGINVHFYDYEFGKASEELAHSPAIVMAGETNEGKGHMWVCDGVKSYHLKRRLFKIDFFGTRTILSDWEEIDGSTYNFYNWGWGPSAIVDRKTKDGPLEIVSYLNGWFFDGVFDPDYNALSGINKTYEPYYKIKYTPFF